MEISLEIEPPAGYPELTELGKRIEMLRIERGLSKQHLARVAGTSRQQLWRVMTGKSEMSIGLQARLADALQTTTLQGETLHTTVVGASSSPTHLAPTTRIATKDAARTTTSSDCHAYVRDAVRIARTLASLPAGDGGRLLKRRLLDAIEDESLAAGITLERAFFELRRRVLSGQL